MMTKDIRPSPIAGSWYPGVESELRSLLDQCLDSPPEVNHSQLVGLLAPHAGIKYSGAVAGTAFRHLRGRKFEVVVVIAPSHHVYPASLLTSGHAFFETPLGEIPVAQEIVTALNKKVPLLAVRNDPEHAIEIELPFLQHTLGDFQLVPLAMIDQSFYAAQRLAEALVELLQDKSVLYVASSDLSHFHDQKTANRLDRKILKAVVAYDPAKVIQLDDRKRGFACGRGAIATVMLAAHQHGATTATIERYATSGEVTGDFSRVVGYGAATFHA